ncbi:MAG: acetate kinase [Oligoflexales bacterium]
MIVLVLNCGSSTIKFQVIETDDEKMRNNRDKILIKGMIERIGSESVITIKKDQQVNKFTKPVRSHSKALDVILSFINEMDSSNKIDAVGHRIVHGGEKFSSSVLIDENVIKGISDCIDLAPLHNPSNISGIRAVQEILGHKIPQVAVFDTAFHATIPEKSFLYALPYQYYRRYKLRRYGFHGTSHRYISFRYKQLINIKKNEVRIITLHLGNGCSVCAIENGVSVDTSMGITPLEGLVMGTRSGDIDPAIIEFLHLKEGLRIEEIFSILNKQSGLLGISGITNDMKDLVDEVKESNDRRANLAIEIFVQRVKKYIASYLALMNGADAIIMAGGIAENSPFVRKRICEKMDFFGIALDSEINEEIVGIHA